MLTTAPARPPALGARRTTRGPASREGRGAAHTCARPSGARGLIRIPASGARWTRAAAGGGRLRDVSSRMLARAAAPPPPLRRVRSRRCPMRLATIRTAAGTRAVRIDGGRGAVETGDADVRALLEHPDWRRARRRGGGPVHAVDGLDYAPLVPAPEKILCVGQNYPDHIAEMGNEPPAYPTVFAKFAPALVGAYDDIVLPAASDAVDYEAELAVVIGRPVRHATPEQARGRDRRLHRAQRRQRARLAVPHVAVPAGQDVRALDAARARAW